MAIKRAQRYTFLSYTHLTELIKPVTPIVYVNKVYLQSNLTDDEYFSKLDVRAEIAMKRNSKFFMFYKMLNNK